MIAQFQTERPRTSTPRLRPRADGSRCAAALKSSSSHRHIVTRGDRLLSLPCVFEAQAYPPHRQGGRSHSLLHAQH